MFALLDVNVLIALLDPDHALHQRGADWFAAHSRRGWASCPITENGCIRIMSHPAYPNAIHVSLIAERLREASLDHHHEFWPDDLSILDAGAFELTRIHGPRQVTDVYLLGLAVRHGGLFVTFDRAISGAAIRNAEARHLLVI